LKIRHGAIVDNVVANVFAKFDDDRLLNEKALVLITTSRKMRITFVALGDPFVAMLRRPTIINHAPVTGDETDSCMWPLFVLHHRYTSCFV